MKLILSLCMIVKNVEKDVSRCLESVKDIVDEMIIVDTGSTDNTVKVAQSYGAKVSYFEWNDNFSDARNFSLEQATGDWILLMDSDEEMGICDRTRINALLNNSNVDVYIFKSLSYVGNTAGLDTSANMNIRLIRNHKSYKFSGAIHEQLYNAEEFENWKLKVKDIIVYHYGYLRNPSKDQEKSERNMRILQKVYKEDNDNPFHFYNIGSEYLRSGKYEKALEFYKKVYENFKPNIAYGPKLLLKMAIVFETLNRYDEEMEILDDGLNYYDKYTDLEYLRACLYHKQKKYSLAIKGFKKCIHMGAPPMILSNINDVGGYKPCYRLGEIYLEIGDYDEAYAYYIETIKKKPDFYKPLYRIADILFRKKEDVTTIKNKLEGFFGENLNAGAYNKLGDIFFCNGKYGVAFEYFLKVKSILKDHGSVFYNLGMSQFYLKNFKKTCMYFEKIERGEHNEDVVYKMILCKIFCNDLKNAQDLLDRAKTFESKQTTIVYEAFKNLIEGKPCEIISHDKEESKKILDEISILLDTILKVATPEIFEKSLQLLNLIDNDEVLLRLAKLYYSNGYRNLAYEEFIRSIKIFDKIDKEGLEMMKNIVDMPIPVTT